MVRVRLRLRVKVIITCYACVFYEKRHSFTSFSLSNLTVSGTDNLSLSILEVGKMKQSRLTVVHLLLSVT